MKIGLITPNSMLFPTVGLQFSDGALLAKKLFGTDKDEIVIEDGGNCAESDQLLKAANKLLLKDRVDAIIAYVSHTMYNVLVDLCTEYKKVLILADMGGVLCHKVTPSPFAFLHSMNEWVGAYNLGKKMSNHKNVHAAMSLMEAGYNIGYSFIRGLEDNSSGVSAFHMAKMDIDEDYTSRHSSAVIEEKPELIFCGFTGKDADVLLKGIGSTYKDNNVKVAGSGWLTLPNTLAQHGDALLGAQTASSYYTSIDSEANKLFLKEFEENTENDADRFALLGYETTMMLLKAAVYNDDGSKLMSKKTATALEELEIESPRGSVSYHPVEHYTISGYWLAEVKQDNGKYYNEIIEHKDKADMEEWRANEVNWPNGGWINPYPCT